MLWQVYGERSDFYFYHLARQRKAATDITGIVGTQGSLHSLDTHFGRVSAGQTLADYFSSASDHGLFRPAQTSPEAQQELLTTVDMRLSDAAAAACEGEEPKSPEQLTMSLSTLPRGKISGSDWLPYEFLQRFCPELGLLLLAVYLEAHQGPADCSLCPTQAHGTVVLLYTGILLQ